MWDYLKHVTKPIILYGTGNACERIMLELGNRLLAVDGIFVSDDFARDGKTFHGFQVLTYEAFRNDFGIYDKNFPQHSGMIVLLCFGTDREEVLKNIDMIASEQELYAPDLPVVGEGLFTKQYKVEHQADLDWVREHLADEQSKKVFDLVTEYRLSGKINYLKEAETPDEELWKLLEVGENETYVDLGAYTGDTIEEFLQHCGGKYDRIIAVEPEARNFRKLTEYAGSVYDRTKKQGPVATMEFRIPDDMLLYNVGIGAGKGTAEFSVGGGRGSLGDKTAEIEVNSVDNIMAESQTKPQSLIIKMDVEGAEAEAIKGAEETIKAYKPKMLVAGYHRIDDMWEIPKQILAINPDYKMYLRHSPCIPNWETNFIFK